MKKILTMIMALGCSMMVLTGCGKDIETPNNENNNNNQQEQQGGNQQQGMDLEIKSTDNKLVLDLQSDNLIAEFIRYQETTE